MTIEEAKYFKDYIDSCLNEWFSKMSKEDAETLAARSFADRHMVGITGQQMLPQEVFRTFLSEVDLAAVKRLCDGFKELIGINTHNINENKAAIATNTESISSLQAMLENDYYNDEIIDAKLDNKADTETVEALSKSVATNTANISTNAANISAANSAIAENTNSIEQLTEKTSGLPWQYQQDIGLAVGDTSSYNLPEAFDFVDSDFKQLLLEAYKEYRDSSDYEIDNDNRDCTTILKALSGRRIFATLYNSVFTDPDRGYQHNLHFKPWQIVFYDKIVKLSDDLTGYATPTLLIEFDTDTTEYFNQQFSIAPVGMEMNIDADSWDYIDSNGDIVGRVQINI